MDRLFLDANVLYSAARSASSRLRALWDMPDAELLSSPYAVAEALYNIQADCPQRVDDLLRLVDRMAVSASSTAADVPLPGVSLPEKDRPILAAAIALKASHLLTGDKTHFAGVLGRRVSGVLILMPGQYLRSKARPSEG